ncbi:MAG: beta-ketoacyl-[acyl-carrier-protein] synthase family protein [Methylophilaceae bacterium]
MKKTALHNMTLCRRVVITGLGVVSPLGNTIDELTKNVFGGVSGVKFLVAPFADKLECKAAAQANFDPANYFNKKSEYNILDRTGQMALHAAKEAVKHSNLNIDEALMPRMGVYVGTGMGGALSVEDGYQTLFVKNEERLKPYTVLMCMYNSPASAIATHFKLSGANQTISTACSSSAVAIGTALKDIRHGYLDAAIVGGTDAILSYASIRSWEAVRTLADEDLKDIGASCKPFSANRTGLVIGEGAAMMVIETYESAVSRGAKIYAEIIGYGMANDFKHITIPSKEGQAATMRAAIIDAQVSVNEIQYINAHGTGTLFNDATETEAIKEVFDTYAYDIAVSSTKSMHGHLMGAAGGLEAIITALALETNQLPPTINLHVPDPKCDLDYVPNETRKVESLRCAMSNSFAFGGTGASLILRKLV